MTSVETKTNKKINEEYQEQKQAATKNVPAEQQLAAMILLNNSLLSLAVGQFLLVFYFDFELLYLNLMNDMCIFHKTLESYSRFNAEAWRNINGHQTMFFYLQRKFMAGNYFSACSLFIIALYVDWSLQNY